MTGHANTLNPTNFSQSHRKLCLFATTLLVAAVPVLRAEARVPPPPAPRPAPTERTLLVASSLDPTSELSPPSFPGSRGRRGRGRGRSCVACGWPRVVAPSRAARRALGLSRQPRFEAFRRVPRPRAGRRGPPPACSWAVGGGVRTHRREPLTSLGSGRDRRAPPGQADHGPGHLPGCGPCQRRGCFQRTSGRRRMSAHLLASLPWAARGWALPLLPRSAPRSVPGALPHGGSKTPAGGRSPTGRRSQG